MSQARRLLLCEVSDTYPVIRFENEHWVLVQLAARPPLIIHARSDIHAKLDLQ
jgi:hypothetical protein